MHSTKLLLLNELLSVPFIIIIIVVVVCKKKKTMLEQEAKAEAEVTNNNTNNNFNSTFPLSPPLPSPPPFYHPLVRNNGHTWEDTVDAARALRDRHNSHSFLLVGAILALLLLAGYTRLLQPPGVLPFFSFSSSDLRGTEVVSGWWWWWWW